MRWKTSVAVAAWLATALAITAAWSSDPPAAVKPRPVEAPPAEASAQEVHTFCGHCHAYPPPETFPRFAWRDEIRKAYDFFRDANLRLDTPDLERVVRYYENRAPEKLPAMAREPLSKRPPPVTFERKGLNPPQCPAMPGVTNVHLAPLFHKDKLDLIVCNTKPGRIWAVKLYESPPTWHLLCDTLLAPCHVEVVDLDGDGNRDLIVAELGNFYATNVRTGQVVWLRGDGKGKFTPHVLLDTVGRVADVQAADFRGVGKLDLVVASFGWRTGAIYYLENQTTDWNRPKFLPRVLDSRAGAIHVPVADLNRDGKPDFVALISQEHETIVAFLNEGNGRFTKKVIYEAPHPAYGSSGIQLVDLNGDGTLDVLYTNGDTLDPPYLLKPYHSVQWLENRGSFPFVHHHLAYLHGAMRAVAADIDGDGKLDIIAAALLPPEEHPQFKDRKPEALLLLHQVAPGKFEHHALESGACTHFTCAAGDIYGDGRQHFVTGNFLMAPGPGREELVTVWKNLGRQP
jgi:FG-GAP-like repeat/Dihaem cytochrome c